MGDSSDDCRRPNRSWADEKGNPFVTFSRLVDEQLSSFFRILTDLPSPFAPPKQESNLEKQQWRWREAQQEAEEVERLFAELFASPESRLHTPAHGESTVTDHEERHRGDDKSKRRLPEAPTSWKQENEEAEHVMDSIRSRISQLYPLQGSIQDSTDMDIRCPYRPTDEDRNTGFDVLFVEPTMPCLDRSFGTSPSSGYATGCPYSPHNLEKEDPFREHRGKWRKAFEELLELSDMKEVSEDTSKKMHSDKWEWVDSFAKGNVHGYNALGLAEALPDNVGESATSPSAFSDGEKDAATELELYERLLGAHPPRSMTNTSVQKTDGNNHGQTGVDKPGLISTLTRTERRVLPDGSIYTQVVLKKRFSDGREESTETEHTTHGIPRPGLPKPVLQSTNCSTKASTPSLGYDGKVKQALGHKLEEQKKRGWFWS